MVLLRQLFDIAGGGCETDAFKHLAASFTVLRSLGSAKTASNSESSRIVSILFETRLIKSLIIFAVTGSNAFYSFNKVICFLLLAFLLAHLVTDTLVFNL